MIYGEYRISKLLQTNYIEKDGGEEIDSVRDSKLGLQQQKASR